MTNVPVLMVSAVSRAKFPRRATPMTLPHWTRSQWEENSHPSQTEGEFLLCLFSFLLFYSSGARCCFWTPLDWLWWFIFFFCECACEKVSCGLLLAVWNFLVKTLWLGGILQFIESDETSLFSLFARGQIRLTTLNTKSLLHAWKRNDGGYCTETTFPLGTYSVVGGGEEKNEFPYLLWEEENKDENNNDNNASFCVVA
jgi:hypothetical protein